MLKLFILQKIGFTVLILFFEGLHNDYRNRSSSDRQSSHRDSVGSNDSGLAVTPRADLRVARDFPLPPASSTGHTADIHEDEHGYQQIHPRLRQAPPYLSLKNSGSSLSMVPPDVPHHSPSSQRTISYINAQHSSPSIHSLDGVDPEWQATLIWKSLHFLLTSSCYQRISDVCFSSFSPESYAYVCDTTPCDEIESITSQRFIVGSNSGHSLVLHSTPWYSVVLHGTLWYSVVLHGTPWYSIVLRGTL